jgi:hypothetical protein
VHLFDLQKLFFITANEVWGTDDGKPGRHVMSVQVFIRDFISCFSGITVQMSGLLQFLFTQAEAKIVGDTAQAFTVLIAPVHWLCHWEYVWFSSSFPLLLLSSQKTGSTLPTAAVKFSFLNVPPSPLSKFELTI